MEGAIVTVEMDGAAEMKLPEMAAIAGAALDRE